MKSGSCKVFILSHLEAFKYIHIYMQYTYIYDCRNRNDTYRVTCLWLLSLLRSPDIFCWSVQSDPSPDGTALEESQLWGHHYFWTNPSLPLQNCWPRFSRNTPSCFTVACRQWLFSLEAQTIISCRIICLIWLIYQSIFSGPKIISLMLCCTASRFNFTDVRKLFEWL